MAIAITRSTLTDDDGSTTYGTVVNAAFMTALYDQIDAVLNATRAQHLLFTDNTYDIGASGATRPRNLYVAGTAIFGGEVTSTGSADDSVLTFSGRNTSTGTNAYNRFRLGNNVAATLFTIDVYGGNYTALGSYVDVVNQASAPLRLGGYGTIGLALGSGGAATIAGAVTLSTIGAFVASDKYLVVDTSGNVHKSATGPAS